MTETITQPKTEEPDLSKMAHCFPHHNSRIALCGWKDERENYTPQDTIPDDPCPKCLQLFRDRNYEPVY